MKGGFAAPFFVYTFAPAMKEVFTREEQELRTKLIQHIIMDCRTSIHNWERIALHKPNEQSFADHPFVRHLCGHYWFTLVIQLAKLYVDRGSHKSSFHRLFDKFNDCELDPHFQSMLDANVTKQHEWGGLHLWATDNFLTKVQYQADRLKACHVAAAIERVHDWRDKANAHQDLAQPTTDQPNFDDLKMLTLLAEDIFNRINCGFGLGDWDLRTVGPEPDRIIHLTREGEKYEKLRFHLANNYGVELP